MNDKNERHLISGLVIAAILIFSYFIGEGASPHPCQQGADTYIVAHAEMSC